MEFNVKDIRSKLMSPSHSSVDSHVEVGLDHSPVPVVTSFTSSSAFFEMGQRDAFTPTVSFYHTTNVLAVKPKPPPLMLNVFIRGVQTTFYTDTNEENNHRKTELMALYLDDISFAYNGRERSFELEFSNIQIDNQLYSSGMYDFPVLLSAEETYVRNGPQALPSLCNIVEFKQKHRQLNAPIVSVRVLLYEEPESATSASYSPAEIVCNIKPIRAYIEDKYINVLLDFLLENIPANLVYRPDPVRTLECCDGDGEILVPKYILMQTIDINEPLKLRLIRIEPLKVLLSVHTCMR